MTQTRVVPAAVILGLALSASAIQDFRADDLPNFGDPTRLVNADPGNDSVSVNAPLTIHYRGKRLHLSQGASRSALVMIEYFQSPVIAAELQGRRVLELGSGTGLAGIAALLHGARVDFTDQSIVMQVLEQNLVANLDAQQLQRSGIHELQWQDDHHRHALRATQYDFIIAADVVYARESIEPLVRTLRQFSSPHTIIYLAYVQRFPWAQEFFQRMQASFQRRLLQQENGVWLFEFRRNSP